MIRFLGNNYNKKQLLQLLTSLDEAFCFATKYRYDSIVTHDIYSIMVHVSKLYNQNEKTNSD